MHPPALDRVARVHTALSHPTRLRILVMLRDGELCVCQITAVLRLPPSTVSAHLAELQSGGFVRERTQGRWVRYALATRPATEAEWNSTWPRLERDRQVLADRAVLQRIRTVPVDQLCAVEAEIARLATEADGMAGKVSGTWAARTG